MKSLSQRLQAGAKLQEILRTNRRLSKGGVCSVCSAHPAVLGAAFDYAVENNSLLLVESTSSQVNQEGGYTGQTPQGFAESLSAKVREAGLSEDRFVLGGDHLGPYPWRGQNAKLAMEKAYGLVRACVRAGYQKIHLDASMACADDPQVLGPHVIAQRAAILAEGAESASRDLPAGSNPVLYVIGTEVPIPGGETETGQAPAVTTGADVQETLSLFRAAFEERGLLPAWERVIGLVVQPGVEFGDDVVFAYDRAKAGPLESELPAGMGLVYEAHSTDYQALQALRDLVEDHFAILKVGPWLTFAYREAIFALSLIERELFAADKPVKVSQVREALENAMLRNPKYWQPYYHGGERSQRLSRAFSYSDRCRYYWPEQEVQAEIERLLANLKSTRMPVTLLSQYLPLEYEAVRNGALQSHAPDLVQHHIQLVLRSYGRATQDVEGQ